MGLIVIFDSAAPYVTMCTHACICVRSLCCTGTGSLEDVGESEGLFASMLYLSLCGVPSGSRDMGRHGLLTRTCAVSYHLDAWTTREEDSICATFGFCDGLGHFPGTFSGRLFVRPLPCIIRSFCASCAQMVSPMGAFSPACLGHDYQGKPPDREMAQWKVGNHGK